MKPYGLKEAIDSLNAHKSMEHNLWAIYVAATFAASGFSFGNFINGELTSAKISLVVGFWAFTIGHFALLRRTLITSELMRASVCEFVKNKKDEVESEFQNALNESIKIKHPVWIAGAAHLIIDICVSIIIIMSQPG